jgi:hypothetical protein
MVISWNLLKGLPVNHGHSRLWIHSPLCLEKGIPSTRRYMCPDHQMDSRRLSLEKIRTSLKAGKPTWFPTQIARGDIKSIRFQMSTRMFRRQIGRDMQVSIFKIYVFLKLSISISRTESSTSEETAMPELLNTFLSWFSLEAHLRLTWGSQYYIHILRG